MLISWKEQAEKTASAQIGKPAISAQTVKQEVAAMLSAVPTLSSTLIPNAHASVNSAIEQLDHRFTVKTSFDGDQTTYTMLPKENVEFQFKFQTDGKNEIREKFNSFIQEAEDFSIDASKVSISGSPILTYALEDSQKSGTGALMFQAPKHDAILKLSLESSNGHQRFDVDDVHGKIQVGHSAANFTGALFGGSINIRLRIKNRGNPGRITFDINFQTWSGCDINALPYFDDVHQFFEKIHDEWTLSIKTKFKGQLVAAYRHATTEIRDLAKRGLTITNYVKAARKFSEITREHIIFESCEIAPSDYHKLIEFFKSTTTSNKQFFEKGHIFTVDLVSELDESNVKMISDMNEAGNLRFVQQESDLKIFNKIYRQPQRTLFCHNFLPRLVNPASPIKKDGVFTVEWEAQEGAYSEVIYD